MSTELMTPKTAVPLSGVFEKYETLIVLDTETSGLWYDRDEIIELSAVVLQSKCDEPQTVQEYDRLIQMSDGRQLDCRITELTGIKPSDLLVHGISKKQACCDFCGLFCGKTLVAAYNAHFDLSFLYYLLRRNGSIDCLRDADFLDLLTIYKDRHDYPHKLCNAIETYGLQDAVVNSHRAIDDVCATVEVLKAMERERNDLLRYVNLFGFHPKFGVQGKKIRSVRYVPQPYGGSRPLYE